MNQPDSQKQPFGPKQIAWVNEKYADQIKRAILLKRGK